MFALLFLTAAVDDGAGGAATGLGGDAERSATGSRGEVR